MTVDWTQRRTGLVLLPLALYWLVRYPAYGLLDSADLVIHEGGHVVFLLFGRFIYMAGGTLMQMILPSLIGWHFCRTGYRTGAQVALVWLGQNLLNISVYASDARAMQLPLLGGGHVLHDWHFMLGQLGLLTADTAIGCAIYGLAATAFLAALVMPEFDGD